MSDQQLVKAQGIVHVPMVMGAVVPIYNLPGIDKPLMFSGPVLADLFLIAVGAILKFAVTASVSGVKLATVGVILMVVGILGLVIALLFLMQADRRDTVVRDRVVDRRTDPYA